MWVKHLPVIMITTSTPSGDILKSYPKYCNCYIVKANSANDFEKAVRGEKILGLALRNYHPIPPINFFFAK